MYTQLVNRVVTTRIFHCPGYKGVSWGASSVLSVSFYSLLLLSRCIAIPSVACAVEHPINPQSRLTFSDLPKITSPNFLYGRSFSDCQNFYKNLTKKGKQVIPYIDRLNLSCTRLFQIEITREIWHTASLEIGQNKVFVIWSQDSGQISPVEKERERERFLSLLYVIFRCSLCIHDL